MTDKELEALAEWAKPDRPTNDYAGAVASLAAVGAPPGKRLAVARLLEERKRLLDGLRNARYRLADEGHEIGVDEAQEAIGFAEEAANP